MFLYSTVVFILNLLLQIYRQLFLSHPFGAQKGAKGTAQTKSVVAPFAREFS